MLNFDYKSIFDEAGIALCLCDKTGNILLSNHQFQNLFDCQDVANISQLPEEGYKEPFLKAIELSNEGYAGVPYPFAFWTSINGTRRKYEVNITRQPTTDYFILSFSDITRRAEAFEELNRINRELSCLIKIHQLTSSSFNLEHITKVTITESCKIFNFPSGFLLLPDATKILRIRAYYSIKPLTQNQISEIENTFNNGRIINWTKDKFKTILINERALNEITEKEAELLTLLDAFSLVSVPIVVKGEILGFIIFARKESQSLMIDEASILETLAHQIGISVQNAMLFYSTEQIRLRVIRQNQGLNLLYNTGLFFLKNLGFKELFRETGRELFKITNFDGIAILYKKNDKINVLHNLRDLDFQKGCQGSPTDSLLLDTMLSALQKKDFIFIEEISESSLFDRSVIEHLIGCGVRSLFISAIKEGEREMGVFVAFSIRSRIIPTDDDLSLWSSISIFIGSILNNYEFKEELQRREYELSRLSSKLISAQEDEKKRIAKEIHDSLGQLIYALNLNISMLGQDSRLAQNNLFIKSQEIINQIQEDIRRLSYELRPPTLEDMGLISALRWLIEHSRCDDIRINLGTNLNSPINFPYNIQVQIFRIAQEAITNILKHSKATEANIFLYENDSSFFMEITDNGAGFPLNDEMHKGIGIIGMKERALSIGGNLKINSDRETGTSIILEIRK